MKITFENLGCIEHGSVELNDFTIFCGKNNSGKTYAMYSIYGLLVSELSPISSDFVKNTWNTLKKDSVYQIEIDDFIREHENEMLNNIEQHFKNSLPNLFGVKESEFYNTKIKISFDKALDLINKSIEKDFENNLKNWFFLKKEANSKYLKFGLSDIDTNHRNTIPENFMLHYMSNWIGYIVFADLYKTSLLLPSERCGLSLFFKELLNFRGSVLQQAQNDNTDTMSFLKHIAKPSYAVPIKHYVEYLSLIQDSKYESSIYESYGIAVEHKILKGNYDVDEFDNISFKPIESEEKLPLHFTSSTVKSLFGLVFYLKHVAKKGDYLMIDEPELNLHPDNQRQVARLLAQLVNAGLKVVVSTHSDYFVRELNNLIMLKKGFPGAKELQEKYGYQDNELLDGEKQISAYLFDDKKMTAIPLDEDEGIIATTFDEVINKLNKSSNEIYYTMQDAKEVIE